MPRKSTKQAPESLRVRDRPQVLQSPLWKTGPFPTPGGAERSRTAAPGEDGERQPRITPWGWAGPPLCSEGRAGARRLVRSPPKPSQERLWHGWRPAGAARRGAGLIQPCCGGRGGSGRRRAAQRGEPGPRTATEEGPSSVFHQHRNPAFKFCSRLQENFMPGVSSKRVLLQKSFNELMFPDKKNSFRQKSCPAPLFGYLSLKSAVLHLQNKDKNSAFFL